MRGDWVWPFLKKSLEGKKAVLPFLGGGLVIAYQLATSAFYPTWSLTKATVAGIVTDVWLFIPWWLRVLWTLAGIVLPVVLIGFPLAFRDQFKKNKKLRARVAELERMLEEKRLPLE